MQLYRDQMHVTPCLNHQLEQSGTKMNVTEQTEDMPHVNVLSEQIQNQQ